MNILVWGLAFQIIMLFVTGLCMFSVGLWGIVKRRPLLFPARQMMWFLIPLFIPGLVRSYIPLFTSWEYDLLTVAILPIIMTAMMILLVFVYWRQMTGYMVLGVYDETFRDALINALNKLAFPFQESISKIKLTSLDADLQAAVAAWVGTAQIRIKQREYAHYTKDIAAAMTDYYKDYPVKVNYLTFIVYLLIGVLAVVFTIVMSAFGAGTLFRW